MLKQMSKALESERDKNQKKIETQEKKNHILKIRFYNYPIQTLKLRYHHERK